MSFILDQDDLPGVPQEEIDEINRKNKEHMDARKNDKPLTPQEVDDLMESMPMTATYDHPENPAFQALQALAESVDPDVRAAEFKESGNTVFKEAVKTKSMSRYDDAIGYYTEGIELDCKNRNLHSVLLTNRAKVQMVKKQYGHAIQDCKDAIICDASNLRAYLNAGTSLREVGRYEEAMQYCNDGLKALAMIRTKLKADKTSFFSSTEDDEKRLKVEKLIKVLLAQVTKHYQATAKEREAKKKKSVNEEKLDKILEARGLHTRIITTGIDLSRVPNEGKVKLKDDGLLYWQVMFIIPEHGTAEFIQDFCEKTRIVDTLNLMFPPKGEYAPWDEQRKYFVPSLQVKYITNDNQRVVVNKKKTLRQVLDDPEFLIRGLPSFELSVRE